MINSKVFQEQIQALNNEFRIACSDFEEEIYPVYDGALNPETYFANQSHKILWLMKEAYEEGEREGDWSLPELYCNKYDLFYRNLIKGKSSRTWQPVVYASFGILNNFSLWNDMPYIKNDPDIVKVLDKVAWGKYSETSITNRKQNEYVKCV